MKYLAKYISETSAEIINFPEDNKKVLDLFKDGFLEFTPKEEPKLKEGEKMVLKYQRKSGKVHQVWETATDRKFYDKKIEELKKSLSESDYKIVRCYEASLLKNPMPYDLNKLTNDRQTLRDEINKLAVL